MSDEKLYFVTEVGVFEEIDIDDPTAVEMDTKKAKELEEMLKKAAEENKKNLKDK